MSDADHGVTGELVEAFIRLARGDFTVRLPRNFQRDQDDLLAYFVNLIAEELDRIIREREAAHRVLEAGIATLGEAFLRLAAGDFAVRVPRTERGDPMDVLAFLLNNTAAEVGDAFGALERERGVVASILDAMVDGVLLLAVDGTIQRANPAIERMLGVAP
ncbi:MAG: PAS domain-containing protein, partial [Myxococcales bacterium]|nr:PAS domain-containing protein [Myxococcales bacterium]